MKLLKAIVAVILMLISITMYATEKANLDSVYRSMDREDYQSAVNKLKSLVKKYPDDGDVWYQYGLALLKFGKINESIAVSKKTREFNGYHKYATFNLGLAYAKQGDQELAFKTITESMDEGYLNFDRLKNEGELETLRKQQRFSFAAEQQYEDFKAHNNIHVPHKILLPENYDPSKTYKGMVAFPPGNFGKASANWLIEFLLNYTTNKEWIITVVTAPKDGLINHPAHHALNDLMKHVRKTYSIQDNKFHFLGYQSGGYPAATYSQMSSSYVTGLTVIGNYSWEDWSDSSLKKFESTPIRLLVGKRDEIGVEINQRFYDIVNPNNKDLEMKVFENEGARIMSLENGRLFSYLK